MTKFWIGFAVVIAYGSIYPFDFQAQNLDARAIQVFLDSCCRRSSRGDILGNVVLFLPFGYFGVVAASSRPSLTSRVWLVCIAGGVFSLALQFVQIYLPTRDENLQDAGWNLIGTLAGALLGVLSCKHIQRSGTLPPTLTLLPCLLIGSWLVYRLVPFVPSFDLQAIKDSLKPLLLSPQFQFINIAHDMVAWLVVAGLLQRLKRGVNLDAYLPVLISAVFGIEIMIVSNVVSASNVVGAVLALGVWWGALRHTRWQADALAVLLCAMLIARGAAPFMLSPLPNSFGWLPFHGLLNGSMYLNVQSICQKVFLYGSLIYFLWQTRLSKVIGTLVALAAVTLIEFAQIYFTGHTPEVTDPLLVVLAALTMMSMQRLEHALRQSSSMQHPNQQKGIIGHRSPLVDALTDPVARTINLRRDQARFLVDLSLRMSTTVSEVGQQIVDHALKEGQPAASGSWPHLERRHLGGSSAHASGIKPEPVPLSRRWVKQTLHFRPDQVRALENLSGEKGVSVSNVARSMIEHFMGQL